MQVLDRAEAAKRLGMTTNALSCHVSRRTWLDGSIPKPIRVGGRFKWIDTQIQDFLKEKLEEAKTGAPSQPRRREQNKGGRPRKRRSASC